MFYKLELIRVKKFRLEVKHSYRNIEKTIIFDELCLNN